MNVVAILRVVPGRAAWFWFYPADLIFSATYKIWCETATSREKHVFQTQPGMINKGFICSLFRYRRKENLSAVMHCDPEFASAVFFLPLFYAQWSDSSCRVSMLASHAYNHIICLGSSEDGHTRSVTLDGAVCCGPGKFISRYSLSRKQIPTKDITGITYNVKRQKAIKEPEREASQRTQQIHTCARAHTHTNARGQWIAAVFIFELTKQDTIEFCERAKNEKP